MHKDEALLTETFARCVQDFRDYGGFNSIAYEVSERKASEMVETRSSAL